MTTTREIIIGRFKHDLASGWAGGYYKEAEDGSLEFTATDEEVAADWIFAQYGNSSTAQFAKEVLAEDDSWKALV